MQSVKSPVYQSKQIKELERLAAERFTITEETMMERAGKAAFDFMARRWPQVHRIAVFCGSGNNGGDGYVVARLAHERGLKVTVWQVGNKEMTSDVARKAKEACKKEKVVIHSFNEEADINHPELVVDAITGTGLHQPLREEAVAAIQKIQRLAVPIFSIDVPTGIDADTGQIQGLAIRANATMTFIGYKLGLLTGSGIAHTGELALNELQFPNELFQYVDACAERIFITTYAPYLKPRSRDWHKGLSGHVLVIGGAPGFSGAPRMAAEAALRVGAGLVSVATDKENAPLVNMERPEIMAHGIEQVEEIEPLLERCDVIVLGPGLGQSRWAKKLVDRAYTSALPMVVDADALNLLALDPKYCENCVFTPHPGEAARLLETDTQRIQRDRLAAAKAIQKKYGAVTILKGAGSLVYAANTLPGVCDKGNPGMASAGMGDVLSGVLGGLISQGIPLADAAKLGVCLHAMAGDMAAKEGERGMVALDLMPYLRRLCNLS